MSAAGKTLTRSVARFGLGAGLCYALFALEALRVARGAGAEVAGDWELTLLLRGSPALALWIAVPMLAVLIAYGAFLPLVSRQLGRIAWAAAAGAVMLALSLALSTGRKAHVPSVRIPFVVAAVASAALGAFLVLPQLVSVSKRRASVPAVLGISVLAAAGWVDAHVLPRLYPPFHFALEVVQVAGIACIAEGILRASRRRLRREWIAELLAAASLLLTARSLMLAPWAGEKLAMFDNARRILDERSAWLGRATQLASARWPARSVPLDDVAAADPLARRSTGHRALDLRGRDVLLVTIDALRADHVGAYGYARPTTPAIDALAKEGAVFVHAYTPAPHTSYAVGSLMTGKFLRPLFALEAASGQHRRADETWAGLLRTYGYRTAAFHPPAIFYVDGERFGDLQKRQLDFEYAKVEFAAPDLRAKQVGEYLAAQRADQRLFIWVHLFEPHEPYVKQPGHEFGDGEIDRYDSEIAAADAGVGALVSAMRASRPNSIVIVSADHGEAFGEHGARYHGTTVYEEQVRVPLIVSAPELIKPRHIIEPVQLIDLMPTLLTGMSIPVPPRVRGRDLGPLLAGAPETGGVAFAEVEDAVMVGRDALRLICNHRSHSCALYDVSTDAQEQQPLTGRESDLASLRAMRRAIEKSTAELEGFSGDDGKPIPEALRIAMEGDADAAVEVAGLLDDVDVAFRRRAAEALAKLAHRETAPHVRRAIATETDAVTKSWLQIASVRLRSPEDARPPVAELASLVRGADPVIARWAALALGELAETMPVDPTTRAAAFDKLVAWLPDAEADAERARSIMRVLPKTAPADAARRAVPALLASLDDVRLRAAAAEALGKLADPSAAAPLAKRLSNERHLDARAPEALALARCGRGDLALTELARVLGVPDPAPGGGAVLAEVVALEAGPTWYSNVLRDEQGARCSPEVPKGRAHRLVLIGADDVGKDAGEVEVAGGKVPLVSTPAGMVAELQTRVVDKVSVRTRIRLPSDTKARACAIVARVDDLPPPKRDRGLSERDGDGQGAEAPSGSAP